LSEDTALTKPDDLNGRIIQFMQSPEVRLLSSRLSQLTTKMSQSRGNKPELKRTQAGLANLLVSGALHGIFIGLWSEFELALEVILMTLTGMSEQNTSIVCTPIQAGIKMQIICSLLKENNNDEKGTALLKKIQDVASRNVFIHSFWDANETFEALHLYHREAKNNSYKVKKRDKNWNDLSHHLLSFADAWLDVVNHFNITDDAISKYKKSIVAGYSPTARHPKSFRAARTHPGPSG